MNSPRVFYVDPMSYHNLAVYDYELLNNIDRRFEIYYYASQKIQLDLPDHIITRKIYHYSDKRGAAKGISYLCSQLKLLCDVKKFKPDLVHFQWFKMPVVDYFILQSIKKHAKVIYTSHDAFTHHDEIKYDSAFLKIMETVDCIIVHTDQSKQSLAKRINQEKIYSIKHGLLNLANFCRDSLDLGGYKEKIGLEGMAVFSALGTMDYYKGTDLILAAWESSAVLSQAENIKLIIAGKNNLGMKQEDIKANNVIFIDRFISDEEFNALLTLSDLVLMPYRRISQSGLLLSALAAQKKILVSKAGGLTEPFIHGDIGWILEETSVAALRELLEKIYLGSVDKLMETIQQPVWDCIKKDYAWDQIGLETSHLYQSNLEKQLSEKKRIR